MLNSSLDYAYKKLAKRSYSLEEMKEELCKAAFPASVIEETVEQLLKHGYLNDSALAQELFDYYTLRKPYGPLALQYHLKKRKIPEDIINDLLDRYGEEKELQVITNLINRRFFSAEKNHPLFLARHLQRKGFTEESVGKYLQKRHNLSMFYENVT